MQYLSGFQALNVPNEKGMIADRHSLSFILRKSLIKKNIYKYIILYIFIYYNNI